MIDHQLVVTEDRFHLAQTDQFMIDHTEQDARMLIILNKWAADKEHERNSSGEPLTYLH